MFKFNFFFALLSFLVMIPTAYPQNPPPSSQEDLAASIDQFATVDETLGLYRGAQPDEKGFRKLKNFGIRTVINFRHEKKDVEWERKIVEDLGMNYVSLPWRIQLHPKEPVMQEFLEVIDRPENAPVFFHCRRGAERTGVAEAVYQHTKKGLSKDTAWNQAMDGYKTLFYWMPFSKSRYEEFLKNLKK